MIGLTFFRIQIYIYLFFLLIFQPLFVCLSRVFVHLCGWLLNCCLVFCWFFSYFFFAIQMITSWFGYIILRMCVGYLIYLLFFTVHSPSLSNTYTHIDICLTDLCYCNLNSFFFFAPNVDLSFGNHSHDWICSFS